MLDAAAALAPLLLACLRSLVRGLMATTDGGRESELVCFADNRDPLYPLSVCRPRSGSDISCSDLRLKAGWRDGPTVERGERRARKEGNNRRSVGPMDGGPQSLSLAKVHFRQLPTLLLSIYLGRR